MNSKLYTIDQVAEYLGVHRDTVYNLVRSGKLPAFQLGGRKASWRITEDDLNSFVEAAKEATLADSGNDQARAKFERQQAEALEAFLTRQNQERTQFNNAGQNPVTE